MGVSVAPMDIVHGGNGQDDVEASLQRCTNAKVECMQDTNGHRKPQHEKLAAKQPNSNGTITLSALLQVRVPTVLRSYAV